MARRVGMLIIGALVVASGCRGHQAEPAAAPLSGTVDAAGGEAVAGSIPTTLPETTTTVAPTTTTPPSTAAATTAAPPTTTATTFPPYGEAAAPVRAPNRPFPTNITLEGGPGSALCPSGQRSVAAVWFIGDATSGTGRLAFDDGPERAVEDTGREDRCVTAGPHTYTYRATGPGGPATRSVTV